MADRTILLSRIRNLLNKTVANGATEAEAQAAMAMAQRIMAEHQIAMAEAVAEDRAELLFGEAEAQEFGARKPSSFAAVSAIVDRVFGVETYVKTQRYRSTGKIARHVAVIFGEANSIDSAAWGFRFLMDTFKDLWSRYRVLREAPSSDMPSYFNGLKDGFLAKLDEEEQERRNLADFGHRALEGKRGNELALFRSAVQQAFAQARPEMASSIQKYSSGNAAHAQGLKDGREINLARPLGGSARPPAPPSPPRALPSPLPG